MRLAPGLTTGTKFMCSMWFFSFLIVMRHWPLRFATVKSPFLTSNRAAKYLFPVRPRQVRPTAPAATMLSVLLIDDDDDHAGRLDRVLRERGFIVTRAA